MQGGETLVSMPTGSGKTGVICCVPYFLGSLKLNQVYFFRFNKPVLVIAPNLEIASQLGGQMLIFDPNVNFLLRRGIIRPDLPDERIRDALPVGIKIEETRALIDPVRLEMNDVIIANAQKFLRGEWEIALPDDIFQLVIVDEAHHFPAPTWRRITSKFRQHALMVFFTATPYRTDNQPVAEGAFAYPLRLEDARNRGIIRRTNFIQVDAEETFLAILTRVRDIQRQKDTETPLPNGVPHMAMAIAKYTNEVNQAAVLWNQHWGGAITYHSAVGTRELEQRMNRIKNNQVKLVVVVDMLREGFDHPPISIAVILTKIVSPVQFVQFVGRSQRIVRSPDVENNDIRADIVTHRHYEQRQNYDMFEREQFIEFNK